MTIDFASLINNNTSNTQQSNAAKYTTAVKQAQSQLAKDGGSYSDQQLKSLIDQNYSALGGTGSGDDIRTGGYGFNKAVSGLKDILDSVDTAGGNMIDGAADTLIGGGLDLLGKTGFVGEDAGDNFRKYFNGNDAAGVMRALTTGATALIPGVGIPLALGKELAQNSDNISEALTGRDSITGESLDGTQRGAKALEAALGVGLAGAGGIGSTFGKAAAKAIAKEGTEAAAKEGVEAAAKEGAEEAVKKGAEVAAKEGAEKAGAEAAESAVKSSEVKAAQEGAEAATEKAAEKSAAADAAETEAKKTGSAADSKNAQMERDAAEQAEDEAKGFINVLRKFGNKVSDKTNKAIDKAYLRDLADSSEVYMSRSLKKNAANIKQLKEDGHPVKAAGNIASMPARWLGAAGARFAEGAAPAALQDMEANGDDALIPKYFRGEATAEDKSKFGQEALRNIFMQFVPGRRALPANAARFAGNPSAVYGRYAAPQLSTAYNNDNQAIDQDEAPNLDNMDEKQFLAMISRMNGGK